MQNKNLSIIIEKLREVSGKVRKIERAAKNSLYKQGNKEDYVDSLQEKTNLLVSLPANIEPLTTSLSASQKALIADQLGGIAFSADKALQLDSIFYMSALLYPENYQDGDDNDLEIFITKLDQVKDERTV